MFSTGLGRSTALVASTLVLLVGALHAFAQAANPSATPLTDIRILFKQDPRLSGATYGGEHWFSPSTFTTAAQPGTVGTVEVRVQGVDTRGRPVTIVPEWTAADPEMLAVSAGQKGRFKVTVTRAGETTLTVASQGVTKALVVRAKNLGNAIQVEITQQTPDDQSQRAAPAPKPAGTDID